MMKIDLHEPELIANLVGQSIEAKYPVTLNPDYADYMWDDFEGVTHEWERKTWSELCGGLNSVEEQLRRENQKNKGNKLGLIVEGVATPAMLGTTVWRRSHKSDVFYKTRDMLTSLKMIYAWLYQVGKYMEVHYTSGLEATAILLVAMYEGDQKEKHGTFQRHLNTMDWHPNPQVQMLMGISISGTKAQQLGLGPAKAELLIGKYGTIWNILSKSPKELAGTGMSIRTAERLLRKIGRPDV